METILITGAEGMVANHFATLYHDKFHIRFYSRRPEEANEYYWDPERGGIDPDALRGVDHIIHLSGARLADHRWTPRYRDTLITSRAGATALIGRTLMNYDMKVKTFVSASAVGYYGNPVTHIPRSESSPAGNDFLAEVCKAWEEEAYLLHVENLAERVCIARFGTIFCHYAGILPKMAIGTKWGLAPILGGGSQYIPWIHINDVCRMLLFMIGNTRIHGAFNAVAPDFATYEEIVTTLAALRAGHVYRIRIPGQLIRRYFQDAADMIMKGVCVSPQKIMQKGFRFKYPDIVSAFLHLYDL